MKHTIAIAFDTDSFSAYTDSYLATLWHAAQANPAPYGDRNAGELAEHIGREIIRRFLESAKPELWAHQGRDHFWHALTEHCHVVNGKWVSKAAIPAAPAAGSITPRIGEHWEAQGGIYAGIVRGENGASDYHLVLLAQEAESLTWGDAKEWAAKAVGELPTRREQALLYANLKDEFHQAWYWSGEQYAANTVCAWMQDFGDGHQYVVHKSNEYRARAVRRLSIID